MPSVTQAVLLSWSVPPAASLALSLTAVIYLRGWFLMRRARVPFVPGWRAICFLLGLLTLWVALASPLDTFSSFLITAHMLQHMLLMMVAPPLLLLGAPLIPLVRGLPIFAAREFAGPFLNWRLANRVGSMLTNLFVALILMGLAMFAWHTPRLYELALTSSSWHEFEHACFFLASLIFWWPVVQPWPSRPQAPRWAVVPYLFIGDLQNTILSAILVFSDRVLYPSYAEMPRLFGFSAQHDQAAAGAIMWVMGSIPFLIPAIVIAVQCLSKPTAPIEAQPRRHSEAVFEWLRGQPMSLPHSWLKQKLGTLRIEAITFIFFFIAAGLFLAALASGTSDDDDQTLRMLANTGPFSIAVFTAAGDLEAGSNSFAFLVQDRQTQQILQDATVDVRARQLGSERQTNAVRTSTEDSGNKLLQSADLDIPAEGDWNLIADVRSGAEAAQFTLPLKVVQPDNGFTLHWPYIVLLVFAVILVIAYLRRHRNTACVPNAESLASSAADHADGLEVTNKTQ
jgi:putative membrane protein